MIAYGASPRATIALDKCARIHAWLDGRDFVTPEDIHAVVMLFQIDFVASPFYNIVRSCMMIIFETEFY